MGAGSGAGIVGLLLVSPRSLQYGCKYHLGFVNTYRQHNHFCEQHLMADTLTDGMGVKPILPVKSVRHRCYNVKL